MTKSWWYVRVDGCFFLLRWNSKRITAVWTVNHVRLFARVPFNINQKHLAGKSKCAIRSNQFNFDGAIYLGMFLGVDNHVKKMPRFHLNDGRDSVFTNLIDWLWCESLRMSTYILFMYASLSSSVPHQRKRRSLRYILA